MKKNKSQNIDPNFGKSLKGFNAFDPKKMFLWRYGAGAGIIVFILQMMIFANPIPTSELGVEYLEYSLSFFIPVYGTALFFGISGIICLKIGLAGTKLQHTSDKLVRKHIPMFLYVPLLVQTVILLWKLIV